MAEESKINAISCPGVLPERAVFHLAVCEFSREVLRVSTTLSFERDGLVFGS